MYLFGASGHGKVVAEIAEAVGVKLNGFIDSDKGKKELLGYPVLRNFPENASDIFISIGDNAMRKVIVNQYREFNYVVLIHPGSIISNRVNVGNGSVIMGGVSINSEAEIGCHCIINTNASIDHDCSIADFVHVSPNASLAGNVNVGEGTHIGIGACVIQNIAIGEWCTIGAGSVIIHDIPDGSTVVGNPGKIIKRK